MRLQINIAFVFTQLADLVLQERPHWPRHRDRDGAAASLGRTAPTKLDIMAHAALPQVGGRFIATFAAPWRGHRRSL